MVKKFATPFIPLPTFIQDTRIIVTASLELSREALKSFLRPRPIHCRSLHHTLNHKSKTCKSLSNFTNLHTLLTLAKLRFCIHCNRNSFQFRLSFPDISNQCQMLCDALFLNMFQILQNVGTNFYKNLWVYFEIGILIDVLGELKGKKKIKKKNCFFFYKRKNIYSKML